MPTKAANNHQIVAMSFNAEDPIDLVASQLDIISKQKKKKIRNTYGYVGCSSYFKSHTCTKSQL